MLETARMKYGAGQPQEAHTTTQPGLRDEMTSEPRIYGVSLRQICRCEALLGVSQFQKVGLLGTAMLLPFRLEAEGRS
jgi:hypothetical protein